MAELLSALLPTLLKKAGESLLTELAFTRGIDERRKKLRDLLTDVNDVIYDAEMQASKKPSVKAWISRLKSAALEADDAIDELRYEALRRDALRRGHTVNSGVSGFFSVKYNPLLFKYNMGKRLQEIVERINDLVNEMNHFGLTRDHQPAPVIDSRQTYSCVSEDVIGRNEDQETIVNRVLCSGSSKLSIFAVVGIGGLGKTTLAQLVFNDKRVMDLFQLCIWVCVSDPFIVSDVVKRIIDSAIVDDSGLKNDNMELLHKRLKEKLGGKRYFLVLDDVWNEDMEKWDALRTLLCCGGMGSVVLVTTRQQKVASIMGATDTNAYNLEHLNPEDSWTLFRRRAFSMGVMESPELVELGKKIINKCCGVPLAVKSMSGLMSTKHEVKEWLAILGSKTWEEVNEENQILPALRLSYDHLPSHMKQCFLFCAVYPKDFEMDKQDLIHYWIANGFVSSEGSLDMEAIGSQVFSELVWRSFFQDVKPERSSYSDVTTCKRSSYSDVTTCKIHDLLHDLAQSIGCGEYFPLQNIHEINDLKENVRHLYCHVFVRKREFQFIMQHHPNIRSLSGIKTDCMDSTRSVYFPKSSMRIFNIPISDSEISLIVPAFMKHLRYLDLSSSGISILPNSITALYNLEVLVLNHCYNLKQLPAGMKYMTSLRHLYLDNCPSLKVMPANLGQLSSLQTLTMYKVGNDSGHGIKELKNLKNLGGRLQIYDLEKVANQEDAKEANLEDKQNLEQLTLRWSPQESAADDSQVYSAHEILDALKPHSCLQVLNIEEYIGNKFPSWAIDSLTLYKLVKLKLFRCVNCTNIPPVGRLPCLEVLELKCMDKLVYLCNNYSDKEGHDHLLVIFPRLKLLSLEMMEVLEGWHQSHGANVSAVTFPMLEEMVIIDCLKLTNLPNVPVLKSLFVIGNRVLVDAVKTVPALSSLYLRRYQGSHNAKVNILPDHFLHWGSLARLHLEGFNILFQEDKVHTSCDYMVPTIEDLHLSFCDSFIQPDKPQSSLWFWKLFVNLRSLIIDHCDNLTFWPVVEFQSLTSLKSLDITSCKNLTGLPPATPLLVNPTPDEGIRNLESLDISYCPNLEELPTCYRSLKTLSIWGTDKLESIPEGLVHHGTLESLSTGKCPSLKSLPESIQCLKNLSSLRLSCCNKLTALPEGMQNCVALKDLEINQCPSLKSLPEGIECLKNLSSLWLSRCNKLTALPEGMQNCVALENLQINQCPSLKSLPESIQCLKNLSSLWLSRCNKLTALPEGMQNCVALKDLHIYECPGIKALPEGLQQRLSSLEKFRIKDCPALARRCRRGGDYWDKVKDIRNLDVVVEQRSIWRDTARVIVPGCNKGQSSA